MGFLAVICLFAAVALAEPRHALIIADTTYSYAAADARAMQTALEPWGFQVSVHQNPKREEIGAAVKELAAQQGVVLVYYSGHAAYYASDVWFLPPDYREGKVDEKAAYAVLDLFRTLDAGRATTRITIVEGGWTKTPTRLHLTSLYGAEGAFAAFSSAPCECNVPEWRGQNSLFTANLIAALANHSSLEEVFLAARRETLLMSSNQQKAWAGDTLPEDFFFNRDRALGMIADAEAEAERKDWLVAKQNGSEGPLRAFLKRHTGGLHAMQARRALAARLKKPYDEPPYITVADDSIPTEAVLVQDEGSEKEAAGDTKGALAAYSRAIQISPDYTLALCLRARLLKGMGELSQAARDLETAISKDPGSSFCLMVQGVVFRSAGHAEEALRSFTASIQMEPFWEALNERGLLYEELGKKDLALTDYLQASYESDKTVAPRINACNVYNSKHLPADALKYCDQALALDPRDAKAYNNRGMSYIMLDQFDKAVADLDRAVELEPGMGTAYSNRGFALMQNGRTGDALRDLDRAVFLRPSDWEALLYRGALKINAGDEEGGRMDFDRAEELKPGIVKEAVQQRK